MNCKNCGGSGGKKGNKHVKGRRFTCTRYSGGTVVSDVSIGSLSDWSPRDESSGGGFGGGYDGGYSCGGGSSD